MLLKTSRIVGTLGLLLLIGSFIHAKAQPLPKHASNLEQVAPPGVEIRNQSKANEQQEATAEELPVPAAVQLTFSNIVTGTTQISQTSTTTAGTICGQIWNSSPGPEGPPQWLTTPDSPQGLETNIPYTLLAGKLIQNGVVNASDCPNNGLLANGAANPCGLEKARDEVNKWQNQFNDSIYQAAVRNAIPAQLLKRVFAQESQFWAVSADGRHFGVGHTTEGGLDPLLIWYPQFYEQACPAVFSAETCQKSYSELSAEQKSMIRGYLLSNRINISCPSCPNGIDTAKAIQSTDIFAKLIISNCHQVDQLINNLTGLSPGAVSSYVDLWRFTLVNYNVGAGCLSDALTRVQDAGKTLNWNNVSSNLSGACNNGITYVNNISQ